MHLTEDQLEQIRTYIFPAARYRETYHEIYDHVINALGDQEGSFSLDLVEQIVCDDFGGPEQISSQEKKYQTSVSKKYFRLLWEEIRQTFRFPAAMGNLTVMLLCIVLHFGSLTGGLNFKPLSQSIYIIWMMPCFFYLYKRYIADRKHSKPSLKYDFLHITWLSGYLVMSFFLHFLTSGANIFALLPAQQFDLILFLFFLSSVYFRAYFKLFTRKILVLAV